MPGLSHHQRPRSARPSRTRGRRSGDRLRAVPRPGRPAPGRGGGEVVGPGDRQPGAGHSGGDQQVVRRMSRPAFPGDAGLAHRAGVDAIPRLDAGVEPMLRRERRGVELRDLPRPAHRRRDHAGVLRGEVPLVPCHVEGGPVVRRLPPRPDGDPDPPARSARGEKCLACHMPKVRYDWLHGSFTDHYIRVHRPSEAGGHSLRVAGVRLAI